jgi:two-component system response regulator YesN
MLYKIFLVEDEIVTRENIRDSVDWTSAGFQLCGEAPDGELALPLIQEQRPEAVITDIEMPFMDGLQLCRALKATLPDTKLIILSGHDEFKYAQEALKIGVTEYLLKPITAQDLVVSLRRVAHQLDEAHQQHAYLRTLEQAFAQARSQEVHPRSDLAVLLDQRAVLAKPDTAALMRFLRGGVADDFEQGFAAYLAPLDAADRASRVLIDYVFTDVVLSAADVLRELDGNPEDLLQDLARLEGMLGTLQHLDDVKDVLRGVVVQVLAYRDEQAHSYSALIAKARTYIDAHYADPEISLSAVAAHVTLSPSYFSMVFRREVGETFVEHVTHLRIQHAQELLRTTSLPTGEIAFQVGYPNPRYFSAVFRKVVGLSPNEFRQSQS